MTLPKRSRRARTSQGAKDKKRRTNVKSSESSVKHFRRARAKMNAELSIQKPTKAEKKFASLLAWAKAKGWRRQVVAIGNYVMDFYHDGLMLNIEVDGKSHEDTKQIKKDQLRDRRLAKAGIHVFRISSADVFGPGITALEIVAQAMRDASDSLPERMKSKGF